MYGKLSDAERTYLYQEVLGGMTIRAGVQLLWIKQRGGKIHAKRRVALPTWLLITDEALIFFPPSQSRQTHIIPYAEVQMLRLKKKVAVGILTVRVRAGQKYTCTVLCTSLSAAVETVNALHTHYNLPSDEPLQGNPRSEIYGRSIYAILFSRVFLQQDFR